MMSSGVDLSFLDHDMERDTPHMPSLEGHTFDVPAVDTVRSGVV
jgi:hypothetical protein